MRRNLLIACGVMAAGLWALHLATRCRVAFLPFVVEAAARGTRIAPMSPPPELVLKTSGIPSTSLFQADSAMLWPPDSSALGPSFHNIHVGLYSTGGYSPVEYLIVCALSATNITQLSATPWDAANRSGVYTVAPVASRISATPFMAVAWLQALGHLESDSVRLLRIDPDPLAIREVWRNDVHSSSGDGVFVAETMSYSFAGLVTGCEPVIIVKKSCTGDDCSYATRVERWIWSPPSARFILASADETKR